MEKKWGFNAEGGLAVQSWNMIMYGIVFIAATNIVSAIIGYSIVMVAATLLTGAILTVLASYRYRLYSFSIDTNANTATIQRVNMLKRYKTNLVNLTDVSSRLRSEYGFSLSYRCTLSILVKGMVVCKARDGELQWDEFKLAEINDCIQDLQEKHRLANNVDTYVWMVDIKQAMQAAYLKLAKHVFFVVAVLCLFYTAAYEDRKGLLGLCVFAISGFIFLMVRLIKYTPYRFSVDNAGNTLSVEAINLFRLRKKDTISLSGLNTEFVREYRRNGSIEELFTFTLMNNGTDMLSIKENFFAWQRGTLKDLHDYIQSLKASNNQ